MDEKAHPDPRVMSRRERIAQAQKAAKPQAQAHPNEAQHEGPQIDLNALQMMAIIQALRRRPRPPTE
jgi:hypothetical protein